MSDNRYPKLYIRSKNDLAKHISDRRFSKEKALELINDVILHFDEYWSDYIAMSQPERDKWVRNASGTKLGILLKRIDAKVLQPHDNILPTSVFGGVSGKNHKAAVIHLLGTKRNRTLLKLDVSQFFEQVKHERVYFFFLKKCKCSDKAARLLADLCCVPYGKKDSPQNFKTIARGFSTSPRLAVWTNLDTFIKIERLAIKELKGKDPKIAFYVDDIGISASNVTVQEMMQLYSKIKNIMENGDINQSLPLNEKKSRIVHHSGESFLLDGTSEGIKGFQHLGLQMNRNTVTLGSKTRLKLRSLSGLYRDSKGRDKALRRKLKSTKQYKAYIENK